MTSSYLVLAYSVDAAGNQSSLSSFRYIIGPASDHLPSLAVLSPVPGSYGNQQLLDIDSTGLSVIRYSLDGSDPLANGKQYVGPTIISGTGRIELNIAAVPDGADASRSPDSVLRKRVVFSQMSGNPLKLPQSSNGIIHASVSLDPAPDARYSYVVGDAASTAEALPFRTPLTLAPTAGTVKTFVLRLLPEGASKAPVSRYTFILDGRVPATPVVDVDYLRAREGVPLVTIEHDAQTQVYFTTDGTEPEARSNLYVASFYPAAVAGPLVIKARSRFEDASSAWSETVTQPIRIDATVPQAPRASWVSETARNGSTAFFRVETTDGNAIHYQIQRMSSPDGGRIAVGTAQSSGSWPLCPASRSILLSAPYGTSEQVRLTFAAESHFGVMSAPVTLSTTLDAVPPEPPAITVRPSAGSTAVDVAGGEALLVSVSSTPTDEAAETHGYVPIAEPKTKAGTRVGTIALAGREGILTTYFVRAVSRGPRGLTSDETLKRVTVDRRSASLPQEAPPGDPALTNARQIEVVIRHDGAPATGSSELGERAAASQPGTKTVYVDLPQGVTVRYTVSSSDSGPVPTVESPLAPPVIRLSGVPGKTSEFNLQLLPVLDRDGTTIVGSVRAYRFLLANETPPAPRVDGVSDGAIYANAVAASLGGIAVGQSGYILIEEGAGNPTGATPDELFRNGHRYSVPLIRAGKTGERISYSLFAGTTDAAGNRSAIVTLHFSVDLTPAPPPVVSYSVPASTGPDQASASNRIADGGVIVSHAPISLQFAVAAGRAGGLLKYAVVPEGNAGGYPGVDLRPVSANPVILTAPDDGARAYRVLAVTTNAADADPQLLQARVLIDRQAPIAPGRPLVTTYVADNHEEGFLSWKLEGSGDIRYRIESTTEASSADSDFASYEAPVHWKMSPESGGEGLRVSYYAYDEAGARTATAAAFLALPTDHPAPLLAGVADGAVYSDAVHIINRTKLGGDAVVRYELSEGDSPPRPLTSTSPELPETLSINPVPGENVHFQIQTQTFSSSGRSPILRIAFAIDRKAPAEPVLVGAEDGGYYQESRTISLEVPKSDSARIFYRINRKLNAAPQPAPLFSAVKTGVSADSGFVGYRGPFTLDAVKNGLAAYSIEAYAEDAAGNRSRKIVSYQIYIDREVIYVSADSQVPGANGSRERPLGSIEAAVSMAHNTGRSTLFVATGIYPIDRPIASSEELRIVGGLDPRSWQAASAVSARTIIRPSDRFPAYTGKPLFTGPADGDLKLNEALFSIAGGTLRFRNVELSTGGVAVQSLLSVSGGTLSADLVTFRVEGVSQSVLQSGGAADLSDCKFERSAKGRLSASSGPYRLIYSQNAERFTMTRCVVDPGTGVDVGAVRIRNGNATISDCNLESGVGSLYAAAIELSGGETLIRGGKISGNREAATAIGVAADRARVRIEGTEIEAAARSGAIGVSGSGAQITVDRSLLHGEPGGDFSYLVNTIGGTIALANSVFTAGDSGDSVVVVAQDSSVAAFQNTIHSGRGTHLAAAFELVGGNAAIANNLILAAAPAAGRATKSAAIVLSAAGGGSGDRRSTANGHATASAQPTAVAVSGSDWNGRLVCTTNGFGGWNNLLANDVSLTGLWHPPGYREPVIVTAEQLNAPGDAANTDFSGNIVPAAATLLESDGIHLHVGSAAIGEGSDPSAVPSPGFSEEQRTALLKDLSLDWDGRKRPRKSSAGDVQWDIGADQLGAR